MFLTLLINDLVVHGVIIFLYALQMFYVIQNKINYRHAIPRLRIRKCTKRTIDEESKETTTVHHQQVF